MIQSFILNFCLQYKEKWIQIKVTLILLNGQNNILFLKRVHFQEIDFGEHCLKHQDKCCLNVFFFFFFWFTVTEINAYFQS